MCLEGHPRKSLTWTQGQGQEKQKTSSSLEETKEMYKLNALGDPGLDPAWRKEVYKKDQKWNINTTEYDSAQKEMSYQATPKPGRKLKCILSSERSRSEKAPYYLISTL